MNEQTNTEQNDSFAAEIERLAGGEPIEGVVLGHDHHNDRYGHEKRSDRPVLTWAEARPTLDYEYDAGYEGLAQRLAKLASLRRGSC